MTFCLGKLGGDDLFGGVGNDWLIGVAGRDLLDGQVGADPFEFTGNFGRDRVKRFEDDRDTLGLDDALWGGGLSKARVLRKFGEAVANKAILDFGGGEKIIITGIDTLSDLRDDLVVI